MAAVGTMCLPLRRLPDGTQATASHTLQHPPEDFPLLPLSYFSWPWLKPVVLISIRYQFNLKTQFGRLVNTRCLQTIVVQAHLLFAFNVWTRLVHTSVFLVQQLMSYGSLAVFKAFGIFHVTLFFDWSDNCICRSQCFSSRVCSANSVFRHAISAGWSVTVVQTKISWQLLDGLSWHFCRHTWCPAYRCYCIYVLVFLLIYCH